MAAVAPMPLSATAPVAVPVATAFTYPPIPTSTSKLPKPRDQMTEADWVEFGKTAFKSWYKNAGVIITKGDRVLLVQDKKSKKWSFPKGAPDAVDKHDPKLTAIRETYEEAGLIPDLDYTFDAVAPERFPHDGLYYFATAKPTANPKVNDDEGCDVRWCTRADVSAIWQATNMHIKHFVKTYW